MAKCAKCGKEVGCGCNLIDGSCHTCLSKNVSFTDPITLLTEPKSTKRTYYSQPAPIPANTEFDKILNQKGLSKADKLKRINDILQKAIDNATSQQQNSGS